MERSDEGMELDLGAKTAFAYGWSFGEAQMMRDVTKTLDDPACPFSQRCAHTYCPITLHMVLSRPHTATMCAVIVVCVLLPSWKAVEFSFLCTLHEPLRNKSMLRPLRPLPRAIAAATLSTIRYVTYPTRSIAILAAVASVDGFTASLSSYRKSFVHNSNLIR